MFSQDIHAKKTGLRSGIWRWQNKAVATNNWWRPSSRAFVSGIVSARVYRTDQLRLGRLWARQFIKRRYCVESIRIACAKQEMDIRTGVAHTLACLLQDDRLQHNTLRRQNNKLPYILLIFFVYLLAISQRYCKVTYLYNTWLYTFKTTKKGAWLGRVDLLGESSSVVVMMMTNRHGGGGEQVEKRFWQQLPGPFKVAAELSKGAIPNLADTLSGQTLVTWLFFWFHHHRLVGPCCDTSQCPYGAFDVCNGNRLSVPQGSRSLFF